MGGLLYLDTFKIFSHTLGYDMHGMESHLFFTLLLLRVGAVFYVSSILLPSPVILHSFSRAAWHSGRPAGLPQVQLLNWPCAVLVCLPMPDLEFQTSSQYNAQTIQTIHVSKYCQHLLAFGGECRSCLLTWILRYSL